MNEQTMSNDELIGLRQKIDEVDEKIQRLINERAGYAAVSYTHLRAHETEL
jgi:chorismate mutase/prephenate dehydratase